MPDKPHSRDHPRMEDHLRVSREEQTTGDQRLVPGLGPIVQTCEDQSINGAKGRDQRPALDRPYQRNVIATPRWVSPKVENAI